LLMGWIAIFFIYTLYNALSTHGLWLWCAGGLCYTVGVLFYVAKKIQFTHAIWHMFVVAGCMCHFFSIYYHVIWLALVTTLVTFKSHSLFKGNCGNWLLSIRQMA
jgi:predicted membrane channel-forming protein YqfA (hemolysin III family)